MPLVCLLFLATDVLAAPRTTAPEIPPLLTARPLTLYTFQITRLPPDWAPSPAPPAGPPLGAGSCTEDSAVLDGAY